MVNPRMELLAESLVDNVESTLDVQRLPQIAHQLRRLGDDGSLLPEVSVRRLHGKAARGDSSWSALASEFIGSRRDNIGPWLRCLGLLRGLGAKTVVIEHHYVCLDHKSEYTHFYAHADQPRSTTAVRLHFFGKPVSATQVTQLSGDQKDSYLGYIVCRRGGLPIVSRAMIKWPREYIDECAAIEENANFLGQKLTIEGVPFMQQDERFAVCIHVAAWTLAYSAYRRGLTARRLISDIVRTSRSDGMAIATPEGLTFDKLEQFLRNLDFSWRCTASHHSRIRTRGLSRVAKSLTFRVTARNASDAFQALKQEVFSRRGRELSRG